MSSAVQNIEDAAGTLHNDALCGDAQAKLTERTVWALKQSGGFRLLLARDLGVITSYSIHYTKLYESRARGRAEALPFADASFDFLCLGYALRHLADLEGAFGEFSYNFV